MGDGIINKDGRAIPLEVLKAARVPGGEPRYIIVALELKDLDGQRYYSKMAAKPVYEKSVIKAFRRLAPFKLAQPKDEMVPLGGDQAEDTTPAPERGIDMGEERK